MYRILWHDREADQLSESAYPTIADAVRTAQEVRAHYCECCRPGYDVVFAANERIVPNWFRQMELERVN